MRHPVTLMLCFGSAIALSACSNGDDAQVQRALKDVNVIDESNLNVFEHFKASDHIELARMLRSKLFDCAVVIFNFVARLDCMRSRYL